MHLGAVFAGFSSFGAFFSPRRCRGPHLGVAESRIQFSDGAGDELLELIGGIVNRLREGSGLVAGNHRRSARHPRFKPADFVSIARLYATNVAQMRLNARHAATET